VSALVEQIMRAHAEVARGVVGAQARLEHLQEQYRSTGQITRVGGTATIERGSGTVAPARPRGRTRSRPDWQLGPDPISYRDVELLGALRPLQRRPRQRDP